MNYTPDDPVQMGMMTLATVANECNPAKPREAELARFLNTILNSMRGQQSMMDVFKKLALGFNAIISSLDGSAEWHAPMLDAANMMFEGINNAFIENGAPGFRKARYGEPLSSVLSVEEPSANSPAEIAKNPATPYEQLVALSEVDDWQVRAGVASNPAAPAELLRKLATDADEGVRSYAARNVNTPVDSLELLSSDSSEYVRDFLAQNPAIPTSLMKRLAGDPHWRPRSGVAENPNIPAEVLTKLLHDPDKRVVEIARQNPNCKSRPYSNSYDEDIPF